MFSDSVLFEEELFRKLATLDPSFTLSTYLEMFGKLKNNLDRVNYVYGGLEKCGVFPDIIRENKNHSEAQKSMDKGNEALKNKNFLQALQFYNCGIARANTSKALASGYANRSLCFLFLGRDEECLVEIERALASDCSDNLKRKLMARASVVQRLGSSELQSEPPPRYHCDVPEISSNEKHPTIQSAKNCIKIERNEEFGRHIVATRDIQIGEIIVVEKPFACTTLNDDTLHCGSCLELCYNPIPCDKCIFLVFCSENCREKARNTFHKHECSAFASLNKSGKDVCHYLVALRTVLLAIENSFDLPDEEMYRSDRYKEISNLMPFYFEVEQLHKLAMIAAFIFYIFLKSTLIFDCPNNNSVMDKFKEMLLSQMLISKVNMLHISESVKGFVIGEVKPFAEGLYSFASLFSHSCRPNVELVHYGSTMVARTINSVTKGQQCSISYGPTYWSSTRVDRNYIFKQFYSFECKCSACIENWFFPSYDPFSCLLGCFRSPEMREACEAEDVLTKITFDQTICPVVADKYLQVFINVLKRCEQSEPSSSDVLGLKLLVSSCYRAFGNRRIL